MAQLLAPLDTILTQLHIHETHEQEFLDSFRLMAVPPPSAPPCPPGEEFELHFIGELELPGCKS